ncbi:MAG: hypothetical protein WC679_03020 [Bacteroidales bacterium]|jgi:hypothetical protein
MNDICLRIKDIIDREFNGNNSAFSRKVGILEPTIRSYLSGSIPKADKIATICSKLEISCDYLLLGKQEDKANNSQKVNSIEIKGNENKINNSDCFVLLKKKDDQIDKLLDIIDKIASSKR